MAGEKTEKATPKKRAEARKKGQVAKSMDLTGALVTLAGLMALSAWGPRIAEKCRSQMQQAFRQIADPSVVTEEGAMILLRDAGLAVVTAVAPLAFVCLIVGVLIGVAQVGTKPMPGAVKPQFAKLNPVSGLKGLLGVNGIVTLIQNLLKVVIIGAVAAAVLVPIFPDLPLLVGAGPHEVVERLLSLSMQIAKWGAFGWVCVGIVDFFWQRHRHEKQLKMDKQEVKDEAKNADLPPEVRGAIKRRQMEAARRRMMAAVPEADVVVTNPTHFAVALKYGSGMAAPEVVAKGQDIIAFKIRAIAEEHGVPIVPDPPLARALHRHVEVGHPIPEDLFQAVAKVLAFVYRMASRRAV